MITIRGAREHNLKNVDLELPRDQLIVFTGISGSGKSSLAFDTIYAEGQRRYVESLSAYARQFLGQMDKPDVDFIEGLSPAISIDQKSASRNPRSTVGTITEIYDYLRLLYARIGIPHCPNCGRVITRQTPQQIVDRVLQLPDGTRFQVLAPVVRGRKGEYEGLLGELSGQGYTRARIDGDIVELSEFLQRTRSGKRLARYEQHTIEVVVDRLVRRDGIERRLTDSLETALRLAEGVAEVEIVPKEGEDPGETLTFSEHLACTHCGLSFEELAPRNFSFNSPYGACDRCDGLGTRFEVDPELIIPDDDLSIADGRDLAVVGVPQPVLRAAARRDRRRVRLLGRHAVAEAAEEGQAGRAVRHRRHVGERALQEPVRPAALVHHELRGCRAVARAPPRRLRERPGAGADRGLHAGGAVPRVQRCAAAAGVARRHHRRAQHQRAREPLDREGGRVPRGARAVGARAHDRRAGAEGGQRAAAVPARRRPRLPVAEPLVGHARRGRGPAHPAGSRRSAAGSSACSTCSTSRRSGCTSATTAGSSTRWCACATSGTRSSSSSTTRRRSGSPTSSSTSGRARGSTAARSSPPARSTTCSRRRARSPGSTCRESGRSRSRRCAGSRARRGSPCGAPRSTTSRISTSSSRSGASSRSRA